MSGSDGLVGRSLLSPSLRCLLDTCVLMYHPRMPAAQTRMIANVLRSAAWRLEVDERGIPCVSSSSKDGTASMKGVAGERCVPSI